MKRFFKRLLFKLDQRKTGCGKCDICKHREKCKEFNEHGITCGDCKWFNVCEAEMKH